MFHKLGIGPGNSLLGGIAVCFLPLPYIFYQVCQTMNKRRDMLIVV